MFKKTESIVIVVLAAAVIGLAYLQFGGSVGGVLSATKAAENAVTFINDYMLEPGTEAELVGEVVQERGLYKFTIDLEGQEISSYITRDGTMLFPQGGIDLEEVEEEQGSPQDSPQGSSEIEEPAYDENSNIRGELESPVTIIEFSDFQCPYCSRFHDTMKQVMEEYPTQVKWVYKHFPLDSIHPYARKAAEASECAAEQGKFWEYADGLYEGQSEIDPSFLGKLATELNLDAARFNECVDGGKYEDKVEADYQEGISAGVSGTPGSFVNGKALGGAVPFTEMQDEIESILGEL